MSTEDESVSPQTRSERLHDAIQTVLAECAEHACDRGLLTSWVLVAEQVGDDGSCYYRALHHEDTTPWRRLGLLDYAMTCERALISYMNAPEADDD